MSDWSFHRHFVLWSKGHYPTLGTGSVEAMRIIMSRISWTPLRFVSKADAVGFIVDIALTHGKIDRRQLVYALSQQGALGFNKGTADIIGLLMDRAGEEILPDVPVKCEPILARRWSKRAGKVKDKEGKLLAWELAVLRKPG